MSIKLEEAKKPKITKDFILFKLHKFRNLDLRFEKNKERLIDGLVKAIFVYDDYIKLILTFDDKPINIPASDEIENMANSSDIQSSVSPKKITSELLSSDVIFLSKPQAWYVINALAHCMESPKAYGITRKRVYASPCGLIPYATSSQFHTATSCGFHTRLRRDLDAKGERYGKEFIA